MVSFKSSNSPWHSLDHTNLACFLVSALIWTVFLDNIGMNSAWDCIIHRNEVTSSLERGGSASFKASTLDGSGRTPSFEMIIPQNGISCLANIHFSGFNVSPFCDNLVRTKSITSGAATRL